MNNYESPLIEAIVLDAADMEWNPSGCFSTDSSCGHGSGGCGAQPPKFPIGVEH